MSLRETGLALGDMGALAKAAEDGGYDSVWFPEVGGRDAFVICGLAAHATDRIAVGTGVVPMMSRSPVAIALAAATLAEASGGRFNLGLGAGTSYTAHAWYDAEWKRPRHRLAETVRVVRAILSGERVTSQSDVRVDGFHLPGPCPPVPIYVGALTPGSLRLAGRVADGVLLNWLTPPGAQRAGLLARESAADAGRDLTVCCYLRVALAETEDDLHKARRVVREQVYLYARLPSYNASMRQSGLGPLLDRIDGSDEKALDDLAGELTAVGSAGRIRKAVQALRDAGVDCPIVYPVPYGDEPAVSAVRSLRAAFPQRGRA